MSDQKIRNMDEFARIVGISRPTLSKYFNDPSSVRVTTRSKIEAALEEYDYRPNIFAINQNRKLTKNIGIVVPYLADPFFAEIARQLEGQCIDAGFHPVLFSSHGEASLEVEILETLRSLKPAGVLLAPLGRASDRKAVEQFCADVPSVLFDSSVPNLEIAYVGSNNPQFGKSIVEYLVKNGEPPCFFEMETPSNPNANKRRQAYLAAMRREGHEPNIVRVPGSGWEFEEIGRRGGGEAIVAKQFKTNTVLCSNDRLAIGLLAACYELGVSVGREESCEMRIAGQDDHPFSRFTCPALTTVAQDYDAISNHAAATLFEAIEAGNRPKENRLFDGRLVLRASA